MVVPPRSALLKLFRCVLGIYMSVCVHVCVHACVWGREREKKKKKKNNQKKMGQMHT